jgi:hypothetical protein
MPPKVVGHHRLTELAQLDFRAEVFNVFNRAQYGDPLNNISAATFGTIIGPLNTTATGSGTPRQIQLMLRLSF